MEDLLRQILTEVRNLSYLFFAFGVIWLLLFGYMWTLSRRERELRTEIDRLKEERRRNPTDEDDDD